MYVYRFVIWVNEIDCETCEVTRGKELDDRELNDTLKRLVGELVRDERIDATGSVTWEVKEIKDFKSGEWKY